jgi:hypothetical protein
MRTSQSKELEIIYLWRGSEFQIPPVKRWIEPMSTRLRAGRSISLSADVPNRS